MIEIPIGCDHAGFYLKQYLIKELNKEGYSFKDYGTYSSESIDYPDYGHPVAIHVSEQKDSLGIVICGSGNGINMTVNKHNDIRSALCWTDEVAALARQHNNANIIALPARFINKELALHMVKTFLTTEFKGGRHQTRVEKIACK
jgi:ribose 5-phosphate isomerase B